MPSALRFDTTTAEVQALAQQRGWNTPGTGISIYQGELVYSADGWRSTHTAPLSYLSKTAAGFVLDTLAPGTEITFAVHAFLGASNDGFYSHFDKVETWFNNGGKNLTGVTVAFPLKS